MNGIDNAVLLVKSKYKHRHLLLQTHDGSGKIHSCKLLIYNLLNGNLVVLHSVRVGLRIAVVNTIYSLCKKDGICLDLNCTKNSSCIGREIRMSGTACEEYQFALCKALLYAVLGIQLCKCAACKWSAD